MTVDLLGADRLSMSVTHSDGRVTRWGPDAPDPTDIPGDLTFSTQIPGGFKDLSCSLLRRIDLDYADLGLFDTVRVYGPGNRTIWEGRMAQFPRSHGDGFQIVPGAVGWSAHLSDDPSFQEVYVDRNPGNWQEFDLTRKIALSGTYTMSKFSASADAGGLSWEVAPEALPNNTIHEFTYTPPGGLTVSRIMYRGARQGTFTGFEAPTAFSGSSPALTLDDTLRSQTFTPGQGVTLRLLLSGGAFTPATALQQRYIKLAVYGPDGWPTHAISGEPDGVYASEVIANIVARTAPLLDTSRVEATTFPIPHLVFDTPTTGENAITLVNGYHGWDWGVYDNREFFYRASDPATLTWQARLSTGARLDLEGDTAEQVFNGVFVVYQDPNGKRMTVGPPGANADATDSALEDTSLTNPVNAQGIDRRWGLLEVSEITTLAGATQLAAIWLAQHAAPQRRGTLTLTGTVRHPAQGEVPVSRVRAGDHISISDHPADVPRRIIETRYTHGGRQITCNLDNTPYVLDALLQRFGAGLVGVL